MTYAAVSVVFIYLCNKVMAWRVEMLQKRERCPHGVQGGSTCEACALEAARTQQIAAEEIRVANAIKKIKSEAETLRHNEHSRLSKQMNHDLDKLLSLSPEEFEGSIAAMYRALGFAVQRTPLSNDFGRDLILTKDGKTTFVECKRYARDKPIGRPALQKFYAAIVTMQADAGIVVTTSNFASTAEKFALENNIVLIDGAKLLKLMAQAFPRSSEADTYRQMCRRCGDVVTFDLRKADMKLTCRNEHSVSRDLSKDLLLINLIEETPRCAKCGHTMRLVNGRRGQFWGCSSYPACRSTRSYERNAIAAGNTPSSNASRKTWGPSATKSKFDYD